MRPLHALLAVTLLAAGVPLDAQRQRSPDAAGQGSSSGGDAGTRTAVPRGDSGGGQREASPPPPPPSRPVERAPDSGARQRTPPPDRPAPAAAQPGPSRRQEADADQGRAVPRGSRPRGDNPATGVAVPRRGPVPDRDNDGGWDGPRVYSPRGYNRYYYPRNYYPYGYGAFGLGYFYYDPYTWAPADQWRYDAYSYGRYDYPTGEVRLQVRPRHAQVYVDGYYAGTVDQFDGVFQSLRVEEGRHHIQIVAPGYEPMDFDVRVLPGQKVTYRGELLSRQP